MDFNGDEHLDVCQNIEAGLKRQYEFHPDLTDSLCPGERHSVGRSGSNAGEQSYRFEPWYARFGDLLC